MAPSSQQENTPTPFTRFDGKTVLITAASSGIGRAMALGLAKRGAHLVLVARSGDKHEDLAKIIRKSGQDAAVPRLANGLEVLGQRLKHTA